MYGDGKHSKGHIEDFKNKHKILKEDLVDHIKMVISKGIVEYSKIRLKNGKPGLEKLYRFNNYSCNWIKWLFSKCISDWAK